MLKLYKRFLLSMFEQAQNLSFIFAGAYVCFTEEGNIVVDGVVASCYPSYNHDVAHITMTPLSWFPDAMDWIFGEDNGFSVLSRWKNSWADGCYQILNIFKI